MISTLRGTVQEVTANQVVVDLHGIGFSVFATTRALSGCRLDSEVLLYTRLIVKEDSFTLFGFADADERSCFDVLIGVSGIGAKLGLAVLNLLSPDELRQAIALKNEAALTKISGIGPKAAKRMILEIGDKLGPIQGTVRVSGEIGAPVMATAVDETAVSGLTNLGWKESDARHAVGAVLAENPNYDTAELLRAALAFLGSRR
ncbi:MAG: Holliday junction branch migration protein RuvA [Arcanobacterium sp.]|nr:Holliday junction branch migration protein RuvA [Arcanobacterium sp.]